MTDSSSALHEYSEFRTVGGEPAFVFPDVIEVLSRCTHLQIAVLGVEKFIATAEGYRTIVLSSYEVKSTGKPWVEFVEENNELALKFVRAHAGGDDHFYLLTTASELEIENLSAL